MTLRVYEVTLGRDGQTRTVRVPSETDVQATDAAMPLALPGESVMSVKEVDDYTGQDDLQGVPPKSQAAELADVTPGAAASRAGTAPFT
ncbi:MAG TPA: hypothetical protein VGR32_04175 [Brevundimonas sp.]|jgi:hypothetical protein|uniref:hypothetical protein n=1 Tax=Brevundimonas sp. TaxID=1871086 RepID=UPI002DE6279B|nr:hypothetical protein [Brevundimonas sp.]